MPRSLWKLLPRLLIPLLTLCSLSLFIAAPALHPDDYIRVDRPQPRATLLLLHGCAHRANHFFPPNSLPELAALTRIALSRNYTALAVSSTGAHGCWSSPDADLARIQTALRRHPPHPPLFVVGVSSGAHFASRVPNAHGIVSIVSSTPCTPHPLHPPPPHVFIYMTRDSRTVRSVQAATKCLQQLHTPTAHFQVAPHPLSVANLTRLLSWPPAVAEDALVAMRDAGFLDADGWLLRDPRHSNWRDAVQHLKSRMNDSLVPDQSPFSEHLNKAWAFHEATADYFSDALQFLENNFVLNPTSPQ